MCSFVHIHLQVCHCPSHLRALKSKWRLILTWLLLRSTAVSWGNNVSINLWILTAMSKRCHDLRTANALIIFLLVKLLVMTPWHWLRLLPRLERFDLNARSSTPHLSCEVKSTIVIAQLMLQEQQRDSTLSILIILHLMISTGNEGVFDGSSITGRKHQVSSHRISPCLLFTFRDF